MSTRRISGKDLHECRQYFWGQDQDKNGQLSWVEFTRMCHAIGLRLNEREMNRAFSKADSNKNGSITFAEFCQTFFVQEDCTNMYGDTERLTALSKERLSAIHNFFYDKTQHHYGKIAQITFIRMIKTYGIELSNQELNKAFELADDDKDGLLSHNEFVTHLISKPIKNSSNITAIEMATLQKSFAVVDDGDGKLSRKEFQELSKIVGMELDLKELSNVYQKANKDELGLVKFDDFCDMYLESRQGVDQKKRRSEGGKRSLASIPPRKLSYIRKHFSTHDKNRDGRLDLTEFQHAVVDLSLPEKVINETIANAHHKKKTFISFSEFIQIYDKAEELAESLVIRKEITDCCKNFWMADEDCDGHLSLYEFTNMLGILGMHLNSQDVKNEFAMVNLNGDGYISFKEFVITYLNRRKQILSIDKIKENFHRVDKNSNGSLSREEFLVALRYLGNTTDEKKKECLLKRVDANNNGKITFNEYCSFLDLD